MDKWEYMSVVLYFDEKASQWTVEGPFGKGLGGKNMGAALSPLGEQGWEAVSMAVDLLNASYTQNIGSGGPTTFVVTQWEQGRYRVLFKRRKS